MRDDCSDKAALAEDGYYDDDEEGTDGDINGSD